ncbi:MAG: diacylglycerol kinase family lipid kinase [Firmicutes bacterium]|nr:diacylglycerol kinase family lipid kinase [Bacillota bacterium]
MAIQRYSSERVVAIVNPYAGKGEVRALAERAQQQLELLGFHVDVYLTAGRRDATTFAQRTVSEGVTRVLVIGGDGTINEVINGLVHSETALGIVTAVSGNDSGRNLDLPKTMDEQLNRFLHSTPRHIDLGRVNGRYFLNVAGCGLDAAIAYTQNQAVVSGQRHVSYTRAALATFPRFRPMRFSIEIDGEHLEMQRGWMVAVANGPIYGGGMKIAPQAKMDDGWLDVCLIGDMSTVQVYATFPFVFLGKLEGKHGVTYRKCKQIKLASPGNLLVHADGEMVGKRSMEAEIVPQALWVL